MKAIDKAKSFLKKYRHAWVLSYFLIYMPWFVYLEKRTDVRHYMIHSPIDNHIPFIEYFIIPYLLWFIFIAVTVAYFLIKDKWGFYRLCAFLFSGMTIFLIICTVFPNALNLRPTVFPRDNMFTDMVKVLYKTDTPTNVLPSIGAGIAISHSNDLKKHRWIQISAYILAALIILSTMFLKQHSVTDVIAAVTMACIIYPFVYVAADKKAPKLSQQPT